MWCCIWGCRSSVKLQKSEIRRCIDKNAVKLPIKDPRRKAVRMQEEDLAAIFLTESGARSSNRWEATREKWVDETLQEGLPAESCAEPNVQLRELEKQITALKEIAATAKWISVNNPQ